MTCNKKGPCQEDKKEKHVDKLTDENLDEVTGGTGVGCQPSWSPCEPKHHITCPPKYDPCAPKHIVGCGPTATPLEPKLKPGCQPTWPPK